MNLKTFHASSIDSAQDHLDALVTGEFEPVLAIVFASVAHDLEKLGGLFSAYNIQVFGGTSAGELLEDGDGDTNVFAENIVAMLFDLPDDTFLLKMFDGEGLSSLERGEIIGDWIATQTFENPAVLLMTSGMRTDGEAIINGIISQTSPDLPLYGGMTGDDNHFQQTFVFDSEQVLDNSAIALVFDQDRISVEGTAYAGWKAVGGEKTVTRSEGNIVYTIDYIPVTDIYHEYLGFTEDSKPELAPQYPLQILRRDGYAVMRAALIVDFENKYVVYAGSVPEGAIVRFCVPPGTDIIDDTLQEFAIFHETQVSEADALVDEIRPFQQLWNVPLIGFYTYGEMGSLGHNRLDFHNETCVLVTLKDNITDG
ncbi:MAG: FIST C-terminal domain-containing protein [Chloroflexi bacterium]|nr:FIST C-terminal domain-containing protein [Chloroflexota bacterium]